MVLAFVGGPRKGQSVEVEHPTDVTVPVVTTNGYEAFRYEVRWMAFRYGSAFPVFVAQEMSDEDALRMFNQQMNERT